MRAILLSVVLLTCCSSEGPSPSVTPSDEEVDPPGQLEKKGVSVRCPVCELEFDEGEARYYLEKDGKTFFFLLEDHKKAFEADPGAYLHP